MSADRTRRGERAESAPPPTVEELRHDLDERRSRVFGRPEKIVEIRDPQGIRAVAHEARQQVINVLFGDIGGAFTATALAELTGLSPSAMSYHLRALEKWGVVERAEDAADGRERPWRAAGTQLNVVVGPGEAGAAASDVLLEITLEQLRKRTSAYRRNWPTDRRRPFVATMDGEHWLTQDEAERYKLAVDRVMVELLESGVVNEPGPGKIRTHMLFSLLPAVGEVPEETR